MLIARGLSCARGDRVLFRALALTVPEASLTQVQGRNGTGKTSLLRMLVGLAAPREGVLSWRGQPVSGAAHSAPDPLAVEQFRRDTLYLAHANGIKQDLDAAENLRFACHMGGEYPRTDEVQGALDRCAIGERARVPVARLSHGQQRRVALARLALSRKALWVLDEPFVALDSLALAMLCALLAEHLRRGGIVILTTHQAVELGGITPQRIDLDDPRYQVAR